jgi:hypothetical protein
VEDGASEIYREANWRDVAIKYSGRGTDQLPIPEWEESV